MNVDGLAVRTKPKKVIIDNREEYHLKKMYYDLGVTHFLRDKWKRSNKKKD